MRLIHSTCGNTVETTTDRIAVRILSVRSGKITCVCPKCKETLDIKTDLSVDCIRCGNPVPTSRAFRFKPEWSIVCERCYIDLWKRHNGTSSSEGCVPTPINLKIK
jgi:hypothetical protein